MKSVHFCGGRSDPGDRFLQIESCIIGCVYLLFEIPGVF
jgi:hypothetical protein